MQLLEVLVYVGLNSQFKGFHVLLSDRQFQNTLLLIMNQQLIQQML